MGHKYHGKDINTGIYGVSYKDYEYLVHIIHTRPRGRPGFGFGFQISDTKKMVTKTS
jgi:hypothetical protein